MRTRHPAPLVLGTLLLALAAPAWAQSEGTSVLGRVTADDTGHPLSRALVTATSDTGDEGGSAITNPDGRFELKTLPQGRYRIAVRRSGYLALQYGQRTPLEQIEWLELSGTGTIDHIDFALPRTGSIAGRIVDDGGDPVAEVMVFAMHFRYVDGHRRLVSAGSPAPTDETGHYRLTGLSPDSYTVFAVSRESWTVHSRGHDEVMGFWPTYFPGTGDGSEARRVTLRVGQRLQDMDFALVPAPTASVAGTAVDSSGRPLAGRTVGLTRVIRADTRGGSMSDAGNGTVGADGAFVIHNVPPGEYKLQARGPKAAASGEEEATAQTVTVNGVDLDHIALITAPGWSVTGHVTTDAGAPPDFPHERARVTAAVPEATNPRGGPPGGKSRINDDWTFSVSDLFGPAKLAMTLPDGWVVKQVLRGDQDITETSIEAHRDSHIADVNIILTNRVSSVTGQVADDKGQPTSAATVILFAADAHKWSDPSHFVRVTRPDRQGLWHVLGLPAGEYLAVAVDQVRDGLWGDPDYLTSLTHDAIKILLGEGASQTVSLVRRASPEPPSGGTDHER